MKDNIGIYIHIPFCKSKCLYCDFFSVADGKKFEKKYVEALRNEIIKRISVNKNGYHVNTIYIGGGTPSYIDEKNIYEILETIKNCCEIDENVEITIEANPGTVSQEKMEAYKKMGINRLSIGLQEKNDKLLKEIGRIHTNAEYLKTIEYANKAGLNNINTDIIIGLPNQTIYDVENTLNQLISLNLTHISIYSLIVEEGTKLEKLIDNGTLKLPDEEMERYMYWFAKRKLEENGYIHYEISNFSKIDYRSRHNVDCWNQKEYLGFGAGASSYNGIARYKNIEDLEKYIENMEKANFAKNIVVEEIQNREDKMKEYMLLGLRKINGININNFRKKFGTTPLYKYNKELTKLVREELILMDTNNIRLSKKGLNLANMVWEEFV